MTLTAETLATIRQRPRLYDAIVAAGTQVTGTIEIDSVRYLELSLADVAALSNEFYKRPNILRPGDLLSVIIRLVSGRMTCPRCWRRRDRMNRKGWIWCFRYRALIFRWLEQELDNLKTFHTCGKTKRRFTPATKHLA